MVVDYANLHALLSELELDVDSLRHNMTVSWAIHVGKYGSTREE